MGKEVPPTLPVSARTNGPAFKLKLFRDEVLSGVPSAYVGHT